MRRQERRDEGVARSGGVENLRGGRGHAKDLVAAPGLAALCAALDDDEGVMGGEPAPCARGSEVPASTAASSALGKSIAAPSVHRKNAIAPASRRNSAEAASTLIGARSRGPSRSARPPAGKGRTANSRRCGCGRGALDHRVRDIRGLERVVGAAIGEEAALARGIDDRDSGPQLWRSSAASQGSTPARRRRRSLRVVAGADPGDEIDLHAEPGQPRPPGSRPNRPRGHKSGLAGRSRSRSALIAAPNNPS